MALASAPEMIPCAASMASMRQRAANILRATGVRSKSIEALISSMIASGPAWKRPPHILLLMSGLSRCAFQTMDETTEPPPEARPAAPRRKTGLVIGSMAVLCALFGRRGDIRDRPEPPQ